MKSAVAAVAVARPQISNPLAGLAGLSRWLVTIGATLVSAHVLDLAATATGVVLVASGVLHGVDHAALLALLAASYLAWAAGLSVGLRANWTLLQQAGTSTNVLSKAAHDLTRLATPRVGPRKVAAALGYVATEIVKEVPYYAGAFGAVLVTDTVSTSDAIVFLAGANLGAAGYEYALGRLTQKVLRLRRLREADVSGHALDVKIPYASFETEWSSKAYLNDYYRTVEPDEVETIAFFVDAMAQVQRGEPLLVFGVGPTLHHVFHAAERASEIHLAEYLSANLEKIRSWRRRDARAHDWRPFVRYTLECEAPSRPTSRSTTANS